VQKLIQKNDPENHILARFEPYEKTCKPNMSFGYLKKMTINVGIVFDSQEFTAHIG
jgi:hypothetical protein